MYENKSKNANKRNIFLNDFQYDNHNYKQYSIVIKEISK